MKTLTKSILFISSLLITTSSFAQNNEHKHEGANKADMHQGMAIPREHGRNAQKDDGNEKGSPCH